MLYSGYVLFNAISLIHVLRSDTFKAERILIGRFEHNSLERLAAASGCMSSVIKVYKSCETRTWWKQGSSIHSSTSSRHVTPVQPIPQRHVARPFPSLTHSLASAHGELSHGSTDMLHVDPVQPSEQLQANQSRESMHVALLKQGPASQSSGRETNDEVRKKIIE